MDNNAIRIIVRKAYEGESWRKKVDKMTDGQVYAVYRRLIKSGRVN